MAPFTWHRAPLRPRLRADDFIQREQPRLIAALPHVDDAGLDGLMEMLATINVWLAVLFVCPIRAAAYTITAVSIHGSSRERAMERFDGEVYREFGL